MALVLSFAGPVHSGSDRAYVDPTYGFSLVPPKFPVGGAGTSTTAFLAMGPASDDFAPNINVQVQDASMDLGEFITLSIDQFEEAGLAIRENKSMEFGSQQGVFWRYSGRIQGRLLEFVAIAVPFQGRFFVVTGTATPRQFEDLGAELQRAVVSFRPPSQ